MSRLRTTPKVRATLNLTMAAVYFVGAFGALVYSAEHAGSTRVYVGCWLLWAGLMAAGGAMAGLGLEDLRAHFGWVRAEKAKGHSGDPLWFAGE